MAWIVGFISQKGGVGKSTKARALARVDVCQLVCHRLLQLKCFQQQSRR